jgi:nucleotide-binding universal stress UspA family protein
MATRGKRKQPSGKKVTRPRNIPKGATPKPRGKRDHELARMINDILVPIDFSIHSKQALRYAVPMAEQFDATLHLVYVVEPTVYPADLGFGQVVLPGVEDELREKGEEELRNLIDDEIGDRVAATATVRTGRPYQEILREVEEKGIDLIVMATHGHTGVEHFLFGSTAARVVRTATCPVLTVRPQE